MSKVVMTKKELTARVNEEAKAMQADIKRQGGRLTLAECKRELRRTYNENCIIK